FIAAALLVLPGTARADTYAPGLPIGSFTITGSVSRPVSLTMAQLQGFPYHEVTTSYGSAKGERTHTYHGALLSDVLTWARPVLPTGTPNPSLRMVATFVADDGYQLSLPFGEFDPAAGNRPILIAYWMDGALQTGPRLALDGDPHGGRFIDTIRTITISQQPFAAAQAAQPGDVQVLGSCCVNTPTTFTWADLNQMPQTDVVATIGGTQHTYTGPLLSEVIHQAGGLKIPDGTVNGMLRFVIGASSKTEEAVVDYGELDPEGAGVPVVLALKDETQTYAPATGARLIVKPDTGVGRQIAGLVTLTVANPDPSATVPPGLTDRGVRVVTANGIITSEGGASSRGDMSGKALSLPIVGADTAAIPDAYWLVASDGGLFNFGGAPFLGSLGGIKLNKPIVDIAGTPTGKGYWMTATDGGVFAFGDAGFFGSLGALTLNKPIVAMMASPSGKGYWLVAADGGMFAFGDAAFNGSLGATKLASPIVDAAVTPSGKGYWLLGTDGGVFCFGDAAYAGRDLAPDDAIKIVGSEAGAGYRIVHSNATVTSHGSLPALSKTSAPAKVVTAMP
ncbi:MAG TPA: hypothetical protein VGO87_10590, partial [Acidimicrobiia bacterium]